MQIAADTLDDILRTLFRKVLSSPLCVTATRGTNRELVGVSIKLGNPRARLSHTERKGRVFSAIGELLWYLAKTDSLRFIEYYLQDYGIENSEDGRTIYGAYGPRLFKKNGIDQVGNVLDLLRDKPNSRRAVIQLFDAEDIDQSRVEIPCTCTLQFLLRHKKLDMLVYMRSNDAYLGLSHDVFAFTMLQEVLARSLGCDVGTYHHFVGSLHLYEDDEVKAHRYIEEGWQPTEGVAMEAMPQGDPWPHVKNLLRVESHLRRGKSVDLATTSLPPYWLDLARLLAIFRASKDADAQTIESLRADMYSKVFDEYIEKRELGTERRRQEGQLKLAFDELSQSRKVVPRWLNQLTKSLVGHRGALTEAADALIPWAAPAPFFGDIASARVATVAVNPSNREFCDSSDVPLKESDRRLETLESLELESWRHAKPRHFKQINLSALEYFGRNPYYTWFRDLEQLLEGVGASFYGSRRIAAAHLDLIPYATRRKWTLLGASKRSALLQQCGNCLADLLRHSPVEVLILNGATVATQLEKLVGETFVRTKMESWNLPRSNRRAVEGTAIEGEIASVGGTEFGRKIAVFGYNHNLQSSYGVTGTVKRSIKEWLAARIPEAMNETEGSPSGS